MFSGICAESKWKLCCVRHFQHAQMHRRILVPGESDVANLAGLFCFEQRFQRPLGAKNRSGSSMRMFS